VVVRSAALLIIVAGCGRFGFDATSTRSQDAPSDSHDGPTADAALLHAEIVAGNADPDDLFGTGVAISRDGTTIAIGAPREDSSAIGINGNELDNSVADSGAVYVLTRGATSWSQQAYLKPSVAAAKQAFGTSVALSADGNTLAVGEPLCDVAVVDAGCVEIFVRTGTTWTALQAVTAQSPDPNDELGYAVALSDDGNTLVTSAPNESSAATTIDGDATNNSASRAGAAYVFVRSGSTYTQQAYLKAPNGDPNDALGYSVACSGDGNTVAVSAPNEASADQATPADNSRTQAGAVYVYTRSGATWTFRDYVKAPTVTNGDFFGLSVALAGDGSRLAVGAPGSDVTISNGGAVDVFVLGSIAAPEMTVAAINPGDTDQMGVSVALSSDGSTLLGGAALEDSGSTDPNDNSAGDAGAAYRWARSGTTWNAVAYIKRATPVPGDNFGFPIATSGDAGVVAIVAGAANASAGVVDVSYFGQ
jgi:hypothetical protein